ncbi:MAG: radical SAM protein, partial [Lachnospiraceae bacterium]|nr:radical SAM protein [Lachnospiraceae bacterium]
MVIRRTRSVCPVCLKNIPAVLEQEENGRIYMSKSCESHGSFRTLIWQGGMDFAAWSRGGAELAEGQGLSCPGNCGLCGEHESGSCCVLLEVTDRCNLHCRYCFADPKCSAADASSDPAFEELEEQIRDLAGRCGQPLLQLSGGEPTLRDDLPELVRAARSAGCSYVQVNTNGIRLAQDPEYVRALAEAGLDIVFLQFDGTREEIYEQLRGRDLLAQKLRAIEHCGRAGIGVTLVPTVVPGVNDRDLGELVRFAAEHMPDVRGIHFQPVSYFGRIPENGCPGGSVSGSGIPGGGVSGSSIPEERYTLDRLMMDLAEQAGFSTEVFQPSRCDHPLCGFHAQFLVRPDGTLRAISHFDHSSAQRGTARDNR